MLGSGLFGTVVSVGPRQVVLEISPGAELTVLKQAITRLSPRTTRTVLTSKTSSRRSEIAVSMQPIELRGLSGPIRGADAGDQLRSLSPSRTSSSTPRDSKPSTAE